MGNPVLQAIPLFVLAGTIMSESGIAASLLRFVNAFIDHVRGGLGVVAAGSCAVIGAISGSGLTGIAAIGPLLIPEMEKRVYAERRARCRRKRKLADVRRMGGRVMTGKTVMEVSKPDGFRIGCGYRTKVSTGKVILSAGVGAAQLGPKMGFKAPVRPQRGQMMITEKLPKLIGHR